MADIKAGIYKGRAVAGSAQYGLAGDASSGSRSAQVAIDVVIPSLDGFKATVPLSFHPNAQRYSIERLRACGWTGTDIRVLDGIDKNEIDVEIFFDTWQGRQRLKVEIRTAGATFELRDTLKDAELSDLASDVMRTIAKDEKDAAAVKEPPTASRRR